MSDQYPTADISLPFPIEFVIRGTPRSHQSPNTKGKELWKRQVAEAAKAHARTLADFFMLDERPLSATIFYFPTARMDGDIDNIVKLIVDGMVNIIYPDDRMIERIVVQKFEPDVEVVFDAPTATLEHAVEADRPAIYIRLDDDLGWRTIP